MGIGFRSEFGEHSFGVHWSYGGFMRFRERLACQIGLDLQKMRGFGGYIPWPDSHDPILLLLDHSDCDGDLSSEDCKVIAPRLREIASRWDGYEFEYDREQAIYLADAMDYCAGTGERLLFV